MAKVIDRLGLAFSLKVEENVFVQFNGETYTLSTPSGSKDF